MTSRQIWEALLTELSKVNAPSMLLQDFNYFINKAVNQYINKRYNVYDVNQQTTDDLRVLKATAILDPLLTTMYDGSDGYKYMTGNAKLFGGTYTVILPQDYLHMLNCICIYKLAKNHKCYDKDNYVQFAAKRLTADAWSVIINDYYNRPLPERPYYYIHNVNSSTELPTNPVNRKRFYKDNDGAVTSNSIIEDNFFGSLDRYKGNYYDNLLGESGTDVERIYSVNPSSNTVGGTPEQAGINTNVDGFTNFNRTITINTKDKEDRTKDVTFKVSTVEREAGFRYGNPSTILCEIRYGKDNSVFVLEKVLVDYIKVPQTIRLTQEQVDLTEDTSQIMEFPDYVCQEIINELVTLVMENTADPRLQSHNAVTQSIASPVQQQTPYYPRRRRRQSTDED